MPDFIQEEIGLVIIVGAVLIFAVGWYVLLRISRR
jgi:hypothetical protein